MKTADMRALVTGATGGIGRALVAELFRRGATVLVVGRQESTLASLCAELGGSSDRLQRCVANVVDPHDRAKVVERAANAGCNVLVNSAGLGEFAFVDEQTDAGLERLFAVNALAPMQLTRALLPSLLRQPEAAVLNVGSVFGSLGYPGFTGYSATKFALRGFTEALRRELADSRVRVHYLAPRSTRTAMNAAAVGRMNAELGVSMDSPDAVARAAADMLEQGRPEAVLGWPEKLFVRVNALLPRLVDGSLRKQLPVIRRHAAEAVIERACHSRGIDR